MQNTRLPACFPNYNVLKEWRVLTVLRSCAGRGGESSSAALDEEDEEEKKQDEADRKAEAEEFRKKAMNIYSSKKVDTVRACQAPQPLEALMLIVGPQHLLRLVLRLLILGTRLFLGLVFHIKTYPAEKQRFEAPHPDSGSLEQKPKQAKGKEGVRKNRSLFARERERKLKEAEEFDPGLPARVSHRLHC